jgi:murein DD-endopeptidase MepM/ murein hydrolase activator NlpD
LRIDPITQTEARHHGIDLKAAYGTPIFASAEGLVIRAGWDRDYGYVIEIEHPYRMISRYAHAMELLVKKGDAVYRQQIIARVGSTGKSTGPHLHYELFQRGEPSWQ